VAGAATGHLPGPVREAARAVLGTAGDRTPAPTRPVPPPQGSRPGATTRPGPGGSATATAPSPNLKRLCQAYAGGVRRGQGGADVPAYCEDLLPVDQKLKQPEGVKVSKITKARAHTNDRRCMGRGKW
jgi:hypothetical protein